MMTKKRLELEREIIEYTNADEGEKAVTKLVELSQEFVGLIAEAINPINVTGSPSLIVALKTVLNELCKENKDAEELADEILKHIKTVSINLPYKDGYEK